MAYDVFISYRRDGGSDLARLIYEKLKTIGFSVFFDLEELKAGVFDVRLYSAIEESQNVAVVLPAGALDRCNKEDDWLRLEVEHALKTGKNVVPVLMPGFRWPTALPESMEAFSRFNGVVWSHDYFDASVEKLANLFVGTRKTEERQPNRSESRKEAPRISNQYFAASADFERRRLLLQQRLIEDFDYPAYSRIERELESFRVLDLGSNAGDLAMARFGQSGKLEKYLGIECDASAVQDGNQRFGKPGEYVFLQADLEDASFEEAICRGMRELGIEYFNVINVTMILMHLKNPFPVLKTARKHLAPGGFVVIRDIDDGLNVAYPDEDGGFARVVDICGKNETSGYRKSGRQMYTLLRRAGFREIRLERMGLSTCGMDCDAREAFFNIYFSFVLDDLRIMTERHPNDRGILEDYQWYREEYETLAERFQDESFFFTLGFILFTARRR